jgi:cold shock CspA family protein
MFNPDKNYGFIRPETAHPASRDANLFVHGSAVLEAPGIGLQKGDTVEFQTDHDRTGRPRAVNVRLIKPDRQRYPTRHLTAEQPPEPRPYFQRGDARRVYVEPAALDRDRERVHPRDHNRRADLRRRAERLWSHPGADEV